MNTISPASNSDTQLRMAFGPPPPDRIQDVLQWVEDVVTIDPSITLQKLIDRLPESGSNLSHQRVLSILSNLVSQGKIRFLAHDEVMSIPAAKYILETPDRWKTIGIRCRTRLAAAVLHQLRMALSGHTELPDSHDQDLLSDLIRQKIEHWRIELQEFDRLCDQHGYPGKTEIRKCQDMVHELRRIPGSDDILVEVQKDHVRIFLDRIKKLEIFLGVQILFWNACQKILARIPLNLDELNQLDWFPAARAELNDLVNRPDPWQAMDRIRELSGRIADEMDRIEQSRITDKKTAAIQQVDTLIEKLSAHFSRNNSDPDERNRALFPLQQIKKKLANTTTPADIDHLVLLAEDEYLVASE